MLVGIVNVVDSMIAQSVDCGVYLNAGYERAVASTKSFTSMIMVLSLISIYFFINKTKTKTKTKNNNLLVSVLQLFNVLAYSKMTII